jgi:hypothetical protein
MWEGIEHRAWSMGKYSRQLAASRGQRDNAYWAFISYHLAFYVNVSISFICEFSMRNEKCEMTIEFLFTPVSCIL